MNMKESKYNYYITKNGKGLIFNGRTRKFFHHIIEIIKHV